MSRARRRPPSPTRAPRAEGRAGRAAAPAPLDLKRVRTYSLASRKSQVTLDEFARPHARGGTLRAFLDSLPRILGANVLRRPVRPGSLSGEILLTPDEATRGGVLPLDVPLSASCPSCEGTGGAFFDCGRCMGEGKVERRLPVPVRIPPGVPDGTVFQVALDDPAVLSILLTVHIRAL